MLRSTRSLLRLRPLLSAGASAPRIQAPLMCMRRAFSTPVDDTPKQQQKIKPQSHPLRKQQGSATPPKSPQPEGPADATQAAAFRFDTESELGQLAQLFYDEVSGDDNRFKQNVEDLLRFVKTLDADPDLKSVYEMEPVPAVQSMQEQLIEEIGRDFAPEARQFITYLMTINRGTLISHIAAVLQKSYNQKYNIHFINVTLAEYNPKLNNQLSRFFDDVVPAGHSYNINVTVNPDILGGMVVDMEGSGADFSIANVLINGVVKKSEHEIRYESI